MDILFLSPADWSGPRGRFQHIASRLARGNRVIYADGLGVRRIKGRDWRRSAAKVLGSLRPATKESAPGSELYRIVPLAVPGRSPSIQRLNRALLERFISRHLARKGFHDPLVWISYPHPGLVAIIDMFSPRAVIYDCVDEWSHFSGVYPDIHEVEEKLARRADLVFATMPRLRERLSKSNSRTYLVPNGVDPGFFAGAGGAEPEDMAGIPHPRIGFVGNIADWVDIDLIESMARERQDWQVVLVGGWVADCTRPEGCNLHWLGFRPYDALPGYIGSFDACIIPFREEELTAGADPLKLYEYLAAGKPVVSTPIPRSLDFPGVVETARGTRRFVEAVERALLEGEGGKERRIEAVLPHSWSGRFDTIVEMVKEHLDIDLGKVS